MLRYQITARVILILARVVFGKKDGTTWVGIEGKLSDDTTKVARLFTPMSDPDIARRLLTEPFAKGSVVALYVPLDVNPVLDVLTQTLKSFTDYEVLKEGIDEKKAFDHYEEKATKVPHKDQIVTVS